MSVRYKPVSWTRAKIAYDAVLVLAVCGFLLAFRSAALRTGAAGTPTDAGSLVIRLYGECALVLLTLALAIGPLARLDARFLPLLYNRRHLGVVTFAVAAAHVWSTFDWYFAFSPLDPWIALLVTDTALSRPLNFPFVPFGLLAFLVLAVMAATSHDFWLKFLGPRLWKDLHMAIYPAYALVIAHLAFGPLQGAQSLALPALATGSAAVLLGLHLAAAMKDRQARGVTSLATGNGGLVLVPEARRIAPGRSRIVTPPGAASIAIFNDGGKLHALGNACAHQNGPLGEGRVIDGCVVCPWHGYEYRLRDGCSPAPFTERVPTYRLQAIGAEIYVDPRPNPLGMQADPIALEEAAHV